MRDLRESAKALRALLAERVLVLDGAMGTMLQQCNLTAADFGGAALEGCNENLVRTRPDVVLDIHRKYFDAGSDIVETNSFGSAPIVLAEYGLAEDAHELNFPRPNWRAKRPTKPARLRKPRFVARLHRTDHQGHHRHRRRHFRRPPRSLLHPGQRSRRRRRRSPAGRNLPGHAQRQSRAARHPPAFAAKSARQIPIMVSVTIEPMGTMLAGQTVDALWSSLRHANLLAVGLNCATGPEFMTDHIRTLSAAHRPVRLVLSRTPVCPNEEGKYLETPNSLAAQLEKFVDHGWLNIVGGCCGTTERTSAPSRKWSRARNRACVPRSRIAPFTPASNWSKPTTATRPLIVGERTNVIGSRLFKNLVAEEKWEEASEIARRQVRSGAHIVDVCLQSTDRDETSDIPPFYEKLIRKVKAPVMIDTTDPTRHRAGAHLLPGQNHHQLHQSRGRRGEIRARLSPWPTPTAPRWSSAPSTRTSCRRRPSRASANSPSPQRSFKLLTEKYGIAPEDIIFDPLVFPCATGDENYIGGAVETIEGIRLIKQALPDVTTILGISNISFGLPAGAREVVNSVFLYYCTKAGLDLAIVNTEKLERFASIPEHERELAENLLFSHPPANIPADHSESALLSNAPADWREQNKRTARRHQPVSHCGHHRAFPHRH